MEEQKQTSRIINMNPNLQNLANDVKENGTTYSDSSFSPVAGLDRVQQNTAKTNQQFENYTDGLIKQNATHVSNFVDKIRRNSEDISRLPNPDTMTNEQKLMMEELKQEKGLDFVQGTSPGDILEGVRAQERASSNKVAESTIRPSNLRPLDFYNDVDPAKFGTSTIDRSAAAQIVENEIRGSTGPNAKDRVNNSIAPNTGTTLINPNNEFGDGGAASVSVDYGPGITEEARLMGSNVNLDPSATPDNSGVVVTAPDGTVQYDPQTGQGYFTEDPISQNVQAPSTVDGQWAVFDTNSSTTLVNGFYNEYQGQRIQPPSGSEQEKKDLAGNSISLVKTFFKEQYGADVGAMGISYNPDGTEFSRGGAINGFLLHDEGGGGFDQNIFSKVGNTNLSIGDAAFFTPEQMGNEYGHVGIVASIPDSDGNFTIMESNWEGQGTRMDRVVNIKDVAGGLRAVDPQAAASTQGQEYANSEIASVYGFGQEKFTPSDSTTSESIIMNAMDIAGVTDPRQRAYILATAQFESNYYRTLSEYADGSAYEGNTELGNINAGDGQRFKGRGYVQLTGRDNYQRVSDKLGIDLVANPHLLESDPRLAAYVLVDGMVNGTFTGMSFDKLGPQFSFYDARTLINGTDKAQEIAGLAQNYLTEIYNNTITSSPSPEPAPKQVVNTGPVEGGNPANRGFEYSHFYPEEYTNNGSWQVNSDVGWRTFDGLNHDAVDTQAFTATGALEYNAPLLAMTGGTIEVDTGSIWGNRVWLIGDDGNTYRYGHLHSFDVQTGDRVSAGDQIGLQGGSGAYGLNDYPDHLDLGIFDTATGQVQDPITMFPSYFSGIKVYRDESGSFVTQ